MIPKKFKNMRELGEEPEFVLQMDDDYPSNLKRLWLWAKDALKDGQATKFQLCEEAFGATKKQVIFYVTSMLYALEVKSQRRSFACLLSKHIYI